HPERSRDALSRRIRRESGAVRRGIQRSGLQRSQADRAGLRVRAGDAAAGAARRVPLSDRAPGSLRGPRDDYLLPAPTSSAGRRRPGSAVLLVRLLQVGGDVLRMAPLDEVSLHEVDELAVLEERDGW